MTDQTDTFDRPVARIEPWGTEDLPLLMKLNDPQMTEHVGGPETPEKVVERQSGYESFQGRGIAGFATAQLLDKAREDQQLRFVHAFPKIDNGPSNAICRKLGFTLVEEIDFPARRGGFVRCNDWRFDL